MSSRLLEQHWRCDDHVEEARRIISIAVKMYRPRAVWALCSGGNDSLVSTHLAMQSGVVTGVASINTTIGIQQTRDHLAYVADEFNWPLRWLRPEFSYRQFCAKFGMPGPGRHDYVYRYLKERCVEQLVRESKRRPKDRVMFITGVRLSESDRRMGHVEAIVRRNSQLWVAPILNWGNEHKTAYQVFNGIPRNPVTPILGISGECLCGAFAKPGEREKIAAHFPEAEAEIVACEQEAAANTRPCRWGRRPKDRMLCQQCDRKNGEELAEVA